MAQLNLEIVTQEKHLLSIRCDAVTVPTVMGEVTILPHHLSLFTKLDAGELKYQRAGEAIGFVISGGFMDVSGGKTVTILADSAIRSDKIDMAKAEAAKKRAEGLIAEKQSRRDLLMAEADLRRAIMELKVARKQKLGSTNPSN
jgi:F-type H+-transporting ATPase subunit epsilon